MKIGIRLTFENRARPTCDILVSFIGIFQLWPTLLFLYVVFKVFNLCIGFPV
jgi:hypothetical protein